MVDVQDNMKRGYETEAETIVTDVGETRTPTPSTGTGPGSSKHSDIVFGTLLYLAIGLFWVWNSDTAQKFLIGNRWPLGILLAVVLVVAGIAWVRKGVLTASAKRQIGLVIFVTIPILLVLVGMVSLIRAVYQVVLLRSVFLLIVCMLPATMYYLFITSRKSSLLQEYFSNLLRLGLFERQKLGGDPGQASDYESELGRRVRVMSYVQKFEAVYGPILEDLADDIILATDPDNSEPKVPAFHQYSTGGALGGFFTPETAIPVVVATLLIGLGWLLTLPPWEIVAVPNNATIIHKLKLVLQPGEITVHFAFLGAYFFSLQMLFRRYVLKDLRANAYMAVSLRIILAVIGTWAVLQAATILNLADQGDGGEHHALLVIGFVIGAFPPIAWQVIQAGFRVATGARFLVPSLSAEMPVSDLDGLTVWHQARLEEEDIENVPNMATADLVELMLNTRVPPDRIVDWVDQAMLYTQLGSDKKRGTENEDQQNPPMTSRRRLREHGIRTACGLVAAYEKSKEHQDIDHFESILPGQGRRPIRSLVDTLAIYPNLELVQNWRRQLGSRSFSPSALVAPVVKKPAGV